MAGEADLAGPGIRFDADGFTLVDNESRSTRIEAEGISHITAEGTNESFEVIIRIDWETADGRKSSIVFPALTYELLGMHLSLGRYPGFDFEWEEKLSPRKEIFVYRAYRDPIV